MMKKLSCLVIFLFPFLSASAQQKDAGDIRDTGISQSSFYSRPDSIKVVGKPVTGNAVIYDLDLDGTKTASGELFSNIRLAAASGTSYKLNSWVRVTYPKTKKTAIVRINDRLSSKEKNKGIFLKLSREVADSLGVKKEKLFSIKVELLLVTDLKSDTSVILEKIDSLAKKDSTTPNSFEPVGKAVNGIASFYSYNLDGTKTSTGERYRNALLTAASNHFKLNTWVLVTNLKNKKSVIVRINDHMHPRMKKKGRVVDLSREAARQLDFIADGLTKVKVQPIKFVFSPKVKEELDSLHQADSTKASGDSIRTDSSAAMNYRTGIASFYSTNLDGTKTATGERYRNNKLSAASNDFDLNTWVRVTNLSNNKSVVLRINDRMHPRMQKKGRVLDLSRLAAKKLDFIKSGLTKVKVEIVEEGTLN